MMIKVSWTYTNDPSRPVRGFKISRKIVGQTAYAEVADIMDPMVREWTDSAVVFGTNYGYEVRAYNEAGTGAAVESSISATYSPPVAPTGITLTTIP